MKKASNLLTVLILSLCAAQACLKPNAWHSGTLFFFDTICDIELSCTDAQFEAAEKDIAAVFSRIEKSLAPGSTDRSSPDVLKLSGIAHQVYRDSEGAFDITIAPLSRLWGFLGGPRRVPAPQEISDALALVGMEKVMQATDALRLLPGMDLDWGGIGKGFGVDLASQCLQQRGILNGYVNAGGDLYCWGTNPEGKPWRVGLKHPRKKGFLGVLNLSGLGAATSGDYQRYFEKDGIRYHHILDPKTGSPSRGKQSVTVIGPETTICDALSTAVFVSSHPEPIMAKYPQYGAVIVDEDGNILLAGRTFSLSFFQ